MKERPILMSAPMVRAIRSGAKTQTRRLVKPEGAHHVFQFRGTTAAAGADEPTGDWGWCGSERVVHKHIRCPYGVPGDRLRVKEAAWMWCERRPNGKTSAGRDKWLYVPMRDAGLFYAADHPQRPAISVASPDTGNQWGWRLKIGRFLPAWASRITLDLISVRVERLHDISETDALAEGVTPKWEPGCSGRLMEALGGFSFRPAASAYADLWEQLNGPGSWGANPWVWVLSFTQGGAE